MLHAPMHRLTQLLIRCDKTPLEWHRIEIGDRASAHRHPSIGPAAQRVLIDSQSQSINFISETGP